MAQKLSLGLQQGQQRQESIRRQVTRATEGLLGKAMRIKINKYNCLTIQVSFNIAVALAPNAHTLLACLLLTNTDQNFLQDFFTSAAMSSVFYIGLQFIIYLLKFILLTSLFTLLFTDTATPFNEFCKNVISNIQPLSEMDLALTSLLMLVDFSNNCAGFVVSVFIYCFKAILLNYFDRKDMYYHSSIKDSVFFSVFVSLSYLLNSLSVSFLSSRIFIFWEIILALVLYIWYYQRGFQMVPNPTAQIPLRSLVIFKLANTVIFLDYLCNSRTVSLSNYAVKFALFYLVLNFYFSIIFADIPVFQSLKKQQKEKHIKSLDLLLTALVQDAARNRQKDHIVLSIIKYHDESGCSNTRCGSTKNMRYDPLSRSRISVVEENRNREASLRYYLKCVYQRTMKEQEGECALMLDYCEFILNQFGNIYDLCKMINRISKRELGFFEQLRMARLRGLIVESSFAFNQTVFEGRLDLENMILAEKSFQEISSNIEVIVKSTISIWQVIREQVINISEVRQSINNNLTLIAQTNQKWSFLSPYLQLQKRWRYIYINYCFFILNQRLFYKDSDELRNSNEDNFFVGETIFLYPNDQPEKLFNKQILFDKKSFYIRAYMNGPTMDVITVSKYFQRFVEYTQEEIVGSPIDILMPEEFKFTHDRSVLDWLEHGYSSDETLYTATFTTFITKNGHEMPAVKYYKLFINISSPHMLEFICLLKVNEYQHPPIEDIDNQFVSERSITTKAIKRQFIKENKDTLRIQNNIFIKNEYLQTNPNIGQIQVAKRSIRLLTCSIITLIAILMIITNLDTSRVSNNITQFLNFLNLYRFPFALSKNYMKVFLNLGSQTSVIAQIGVGTQNVLSFNSDPLTIKTLFDPQLNVPNLYFPFRNTTFNKGLSYDQIEIYHVVISGIMSLSKFPINRTGYDFSMLDNYLLPSYDHMINATKIKFHKTFQANLNLMLIDQIIIALVQFIIFVLIVTFVCLKIRSYFRKSRNILLIVFEFSDINVQRIRKYWKRVLKHFQKLNFKNKAYCMSTNISLSASKALHIDLDIDTIKTNMQQEQTISFNRKSKVVQETRKSHNQFIKYMVAIGFSVLLLIMLVLSIELINIIQIMSLTAFENDGYYFLQYYPATSVLGHALMERYYSQLYPKEVDYRPERYADYISDMNLIGQSTYIGSVSNPSSQYILKRKNYMFGNPCTYSPQVLIAANSTVAKCSSLQNKTLTQGLATFLRFAQPTVDQYINGKIKLTASQLDSLTSALTLVAYYVTDAITTWAGQFSAGVLKYQNMGNMLCLVTASVILLLHLVFCEKILFFSLQRDYSFVRQVYDKMIPEYILQIEKVIKHRLIIEGIIRQS